MNLTQAQSLLFGRERDNLGASLVALARGVEPRFGANGLANAFSVRRELGRVTARGQAAVLSARLVPEGGGTEYKLSYDTRFNAINETVYDLGRTSMYPRITDMLARYSLQATAAEQSTRFTFKVGDTVSLSIIHGIFMYEGIDRLDGVEVVYSSKFKRTIGATMDDEGAEALKDQHSDQFRQLAGSVPDLGLPTTKPFADAFVRAVDVIAPQVVFVRTKTEV